VRLALVVMCLTAGARVAAADDVAVWQDAELRVEPDGATFKLAKLDGARADHRAATFAVHILATRGKLVEVEPACGSTLRGRGLAHVHLFVARADFAGKPSRTDAACKDLAVAIDDSPSDGDDTREILPTGTQLQTPGGRAVAIAAAPIAVTLITGAKRVCVSRDVVLDGGGASPIQVCAPARAVRRAGRHLGD
jgi:hypothetical protein